MIRRLYCEKISTHNVLAIFYFVLFYCVDLIFSSSTLARLIKITKIRDRTVGKKDLGFDLPWIDLFHLTVRRQQIQIQKKSFMCTEYLERKNGKGKRSWHA